MKNKRLMVFFYILLLSLIILIVILLIKNGSNNSSIDNNSGNKNTSKNKTTEIKKSKSDGNTTKKTETPEKKEISPVPIEEEKVENRNEKIDNITVNLELKGDDEVEIKVGEKYEDAGCVATDENGNDVSDKISVENNVNINKKGEYMVMYSYGKSVAIRKVIVK